MPDTGPWCGRVSAGEGSVHDADASPPAPAAPHAGYSFRTRVWHVEAHDVERVELDGDGPPLLVVLVHLDTKGDLVIEAVADKDGRARVALDVGGEGGSAPAAPEALRAGTWRMYLFRLRAGPVALVVGQQLFVLLWEWGRRKAEVALSRTHAQRWARRMASSERQHWASRTLVWLSCSLVSCRKSTSGFSAWRISVCV